MQEGGDRGKGPNKTGTQPKKRTRITSETEPDENSRWREQCAKDWTEEDRAWTDAAVGR